MTWHRGWLIAAVASMAALVAMGCARPGATSSTSTGPPRCADLVAHAMTTQAPQPVVGAFACLAPSVQAQARVLAITDDASFAEYAAGDPVYTAYHYIGHTPPAVPKPEKVWYYFEITPQQCYRVSLDADGLVDAGGFGPQGAACPTTLP